VIVEAAARILEDRGHARFSTNVVAERAGVSVGSLYQYFSSKDALIGALIKRETSLLVEDAEQAAEKLGGKKALSALVAACASHQLRRPKLALLLDFEEARLPFDADVQQVKKRITTIILRMLSQPDVPPQPNLEVAARDVMAIIKGLVDAAGAAGEMDSAVLVGRVEKAVYGYLLPAPPKRRKSCARL
jgi:AcrR family transcriptional regulator